MAAIKDVAKLAGVSASAVSKFFRTPENMREDTRQKISAAVEALHFQPNQLARSLRNGRSGIIAVTISDIMNPYVSQFSMLMQQHCNDAGFTPLLVQIDNMRDSSQAIQLLKSGLLDGVICLDDGPFVRLALQSGVQIPIIQITAVTDTPVSSTVTIDLNHGMELLCRHLQEQNVQTLGFIGPKDDFSAIWKLNIVRDYCRAHAMQLLPDAIVTPHASIVQNSGYVHGYTACQQLLRQITALPDALICCSDIWLVGTLKCLTENGIRVPEDILIAGHDDSILAQMSNPPITSVQMPVALMCKYSVRNLYQLLNGGTVEPVVIPTSLAIRVSTLRHASPPAAAL